MLTPVSSAPKATPTPPSSFSSAAIRPATEVPCEIGRVAVELLAVDDDLAVRIVAVVEIGMVVLDAVVIDADRNTGARILVPDRLDVADGLEVPLVDIERIVRPHLLTPSEPEPMLPPRRIAASSYANCIAEDKRERQLEVPRPDPGGP